MDGRRMYRQAREFKGYSVSSLDQLPEVCATQCLSVDLFFDHRHCPAGCAADAGLAVSQNRPDEIFD